MHRYNSNIDSEWVIMCHWIVWLIKINNFNMKNPICTVACNKFPCIITVTFLNTRSNYWTDDFCSFREGFYQDGSRNKANFLILVILNKNGFFPEFYLMTFKTFTNILWCGRFLWETNFKMWSYRSDLIKYGSNLFKIWSLLALPSA